ncbi:MAG: class I SAM-dependent methyltransferase [Halieaceae bacterium]|nr:class I SAM-dependent methyltransferase [Halieaceae bacterium]
MKRAASGAALFAAILTSFASGQSITEDVQRAMQLEYRTSADTTRDANRAPADAVAFMGLEADMSVFEFAPGNGWYTKLLAPVLKDSGSLTIGYPHEWLADLSDLISTPPMAKVRQVSMAMDWDYDLRAYSFEGIDFDSTNLDMFLNIREYHNLHGDDRAAFNRAVFAALKPGGRYIVIDHTRRHNQPDTPENWRREDPVVVLTEVQDAGFVLLKSSDMFYKPDDSLAFEVGRKTVTGNTDRFFFVFEKPE